MSKYLIFNERDLLILNNLFYFKCMNYNQMLKLLDLNGFEMSYGSLRNRMNDYAKHNYVEKIDFENKAYWFPKRKTLTLIHAEIQNVKPSYAIIRHTSYVTDVALYFMEKFPNYKIITERQHIQMEEINFLKNKKAVADFLIVDENNILKYVVEVEINRKKRKIFKDKCRRLLLTYLLPNEEHMSKVIWVIPKNMESVKNRLEEDNVIPSFMYEIYWLENIV